MLEKVYVNEKKLGTITCPKCKKLWEKDFSQVKDFQKKNMLKCKCPCGNSFPIKLERRRHYRKMTNLTGSYMHDKTKKRGLVNIKNVSKSGARLELNTQHLIPTGDKLTLKFNLDDVQRSYMCKEAVVKKSDGSTVGLEFSDLEPDEKFDDFLKE
jgi:hypothetical protein